MTKRIPNDLMYIAILFGIFAVQFLFPLLNFEWLQNTLGGHGSSSQDMPLHEVLDLLKFFARP